jgi:hypothetical protein
VIRSNSRTIELSYIFGSQGAYSHLPPFRASWGEIVRVGGGRYNGPLPFYPGRKDIVVLPNGKSVIEDVTPVGDVVGG